MALAVAPPATASPAEHRAAILRLVAVGSAIREAALSLEQAGMLGIDIRSPMPAPDCAQFFQDVVSMRHVEAVRSGGTDLDGTLVLRWHGRVELELRVRSSCPDGTAKCAAPALELLELHDRAGMRPACSVRRVRRREAVGWRGKLTPMLLDFPGAARGPAQVFQVDVERAPAAQPLPPE